MNDREAWEEMKRSSPCAWVPGFLIVIKSTFLTKLFLTRTESL